ncbi:hypothetical protein Q7P37_011120 [Cladosporium fusiforme]
MTVPPPHHDTEMTFEERLESQLGKGGTNNIPTVFSLPELQPNVFNFTINHTRLEETTKLFNEYLQTGKDFPTPLFLDIEAKQYIDKTIMLYAKEASEFKAFSQLPRCRITPKSFAMCGQIAKSPSVDASLVRGVLLNEAKRGHECAADIVELFHRVQSLNRLSSLIKLALLSKPFVLADAWGWVNEQSLVFCEDTVARHVEALSRMWQGIEDIQDHGPPWVTSELIRLQADMMRMTLDAHFAAAGYGLPGDESAHADELRAYCGHMLEQRSSSKYGNGSSWVDSLMVFVEEKKIECGWV